MDISGLLTTFIILLNLLKDGRSIYRVPLLDVSMIDEFIDESRDKLYIILFYSSVGCLDCRDAMKEFQDAAEPFNDPRADVEFAQIDTLRDKYVEMRFNARMIPLVIYYLPGSTEPLKLDPDEAITKKNLLDLVSKNIKMKPSKKPPSITYTSKLVSNIERINKVLEEKMASVLLLFYATGCTKECQYFEEAAQAFKNEVRVLFLRINVNDKPKLIKQLDLRSNPSVKWYDRKKEGRSKEFIGTITVDKLVTFVNDQAMLARNKDGTLKEKAATSPEMNVVVEMNIGNLLAGDINAITAVKGEGRRLKAETNYDEYYLNYYMEIVDGLHDHGEKGLKEESAQIDAILINADPKKESRRLDDATKKKNILDVFYAAAAKNMFQNMNINAGDINRVQLDELPKARVAPPIRGHREL
ncbi:unnamed protein product [Owenia fusiformis]|uniref:Uncharacterized protein n=1 Tax=Owenia fusiformis TaxID=6347 RepID=A0A8J1URA0_OWEFU|nr:unnamed protein product [Owenia fusiformis]